MQLPLLGKILVSEGSNGTTQLVSSELYSPLLNLWMPAGSQQVPRTGFTNNPNNNDHAQVPGKTILVHDHPCSSLICHRKTRWKHARKHCT